MNPACLSATSGGYSRFGIPYDVDRKKKPYVESIRDCKAQRIETLQYAAYAWQACCAAQQARRSQWRLFVPALETIQLNHYMYVGFEANYE